MTTPLYCTDKMCGATDCRTCYPSSWKDEMMDVFTEEIIQAVGVFLDKSNKEQQMEFLERHWVHYLEEFNTSVSKIKKNWNKPYPSSREITLYEYCLEAWMENATEEAKGVSADDEEGLAKWSAYGEYLELEHQAMSN